MDYIKIIEQTFNSHGISKFSDLKSESFKKSDNYPSSTGIKFEHKNFAGEIFHYSNGEMEYCEMEFLIFDGEKYETKIIDKPNEMEMENAISEFLNIILTELKNVA